MYLSKKPITKFKGDFCMKKGIIFTTALAMVLGVGVAVGAHQVTPKAVEAAPVSTVYCKMTYAWWTTDNAAIAAYCWNSEDESDKNAEWPGVRMTKVVGQDGLWSYTVPNGYDKVIFVRTNPSGATADWGSQTEDLEIPSVKNCFTITSATARWGSDKVEGNWSVYPTVAPIYHLLGTFNDWEDPKNEYVLTVDDKDDNHYTIDDVVLKKDDELKVYDPNNDDWYGNLGENVIVESSGTYDVDFYVKADNDIHVVLTKEEVDPVYTLDFGSFDPGILLELDDEGKPEGVLHQYSAELDYASRAKELKFYKDGDLITEKIGVDEGENNVYGNATDGFRIYHPNFYGKTKVYLKTYADGGYSIWGAGYGENSFRTAIWNSDHGQATAYNLTLDEEFTPNETYIEQYKTSEAIVLNALDGTTEYNSFDMMCGGVSESITPENVPNNNARQAYQSSAWKVHNDCEEVIYLKIKRTDLSAWIFVDGYEAVHVLTIGGQEVDLNKAEGSEYAAHNVNLAAGAEVTSYTIEGVEQTVTAKADKTNNLASNMKVITANASADIYFDTETNTLWISGLEALANGFHLYINTTVHVLKSRVNEYLVTEYYSTLISFAANDEIRFIHIQDGAAPDIFGDAVVEGGPQSSHFDYSETKYCIVAKEACDSALYFKPGTPNNNVWFDTVTQDLKDAKEFADAFNKALELICKADGTTDKEALATAWLAKKATFTDDLIEEAQNILKAATKDYPVEEIAKFIAKYELIATRYGNFLATKDAKWNFLGKSITSVGAIELNNNSIEPSSLIVIVSIIAVTSISAVGILLVIKKRRHN